jgi:hypothetical protein
MALEENPDLQPALEEFFRLKDEGLTSEKLGSYFARWERKLGIEYKERLEKQVSRHAKARQVLSA